MGNDFLILNSQILISHSTFPIPHHSPLTRVTTMEFLKLAQNRYSCRKFSDKAVESDKLSTVL